MGWLADILREFPAVSVAKERLALVEQKYSDLEKKYDEACEEIKTLKTENAELKATLQEFEAQEKPSEMPPELGKLLVYLFTNIEDSQVHTDAIAQALGVQNQMAKYYIDKLVELGLARMTGGNTITGWVFYGLTEKGRAFVVEKGLLSK